MKGCGQWRYEQNCIVESRINESVPGNQTLRLWKLPGPGFSIFYVLFSISCFKRMRLEEIAGGEEAFELFHFHLSLKRKIIFEFWDVLFPLRYQRSSSAQLTQPPVSDLWDNASVKLPPSLHCLPRGWHCNIACSLKETNITRPLYILP